MSWIVMPTRHPMMSRLLWLTALMCLAWWSLGRATHAEPVPLPASLQAVPFTIGEWRGRDEPEFQPDVLAMLGVDDYLNRVYRTDDAAVGLYVGYYDSQRQGGAAHSPMNCLPGTGWTPVRSDYLTIAVPRESDARGAPITVRRYRVRRGADEALVFYWYQSHGRVVANEYWSKAYLVYDAVRLNRTDTALVRLVSMLPDDRADAQRAERATVAFARAAFPVLERHLPR
jgi:EpsI family protein